MQNAKSEQKGRPGNKVLEPNPVLKEMKKLKERLDAK